MNGRQIVNEGRMPRCICWRYRISKRIENRACFLLLFEWPVAITVNSRLFELIIQSFNLAFFTFQFFFQLVYLLIEVLDHIVSQLHLHRFSL